MRGESCLQGSERIRPQPRYVRRPRPRCRPVKPPVLLCNRHVVDRGLAPPHQAVLVELPLLVAVGAVPLAAGIVPFVLEAHSDAVFIKRPEVLDQAVVVLLLPFAGEERDDGFAPLKNLGAIAPAAVLGIGQRDAHRVARIPGILGHARLLRGGLTCEGWKRRARHDGLICWRECNLSPRAGESRGRPLSPDHEIRSAFIKARMDFGIGWARPPLMKATRTSAFTSASSPRRTSCASMLEAPFTATGQVTTSSTSSIRAGRMKSRCIERTTKAKPAPSVSAGSNSACCSAPISRR